jgi:DNA-directed RNA polymerase I, II, and III subunit RPABC5
MTALAQLHGGRSEQPLASVQKRRATLGCCCGCSASFYCDCTNECTGEGWVIVECVIDFMKGIENTGGAVNESANTLVHILKWSVSTGCTIELTVKCFNCGNVIANKYEYYLAEVRRLKIARGMDTEKVIYLTKEYINKTPEGEVMDALKLKKMCCRRHFLTHVDIE